MAFLGVTYGYFGKVSSRPTIVNAPNDSQWSTRRLGTQLKVSHMMVARVWAKHGLKPQRPEGYMASNDPDLSRRPPTSLGCI